MEAAANPHFAGLRLVLAIDMLLRDRHSLKPLFLDESTANDANAVGTACNAFERFLELLDIVAGALRMEKCFFALDRVRALLGSVERVVLVIGLEFAGSIENILAKDIEFLTRFLLLIDDQLAKQFEVLATISFLRGGKDFRIVRAQAHGRSGPS